LHNRILVIGATGRVGRKVISQLSGTGAEVRALVRNPQAADLPAWVEVVRGDLTAPETLDGCVDGVDAVFLVWTAPQAAVDSALARITKHARRVVLLSSPHKTAHPFFQQPNPMRTLHEQIEQRIETSGCQWTFLRPGMFASNSLAFWAPAIRSGDTVRWPYPETPTAPVDDRDIAAVAMRVLRDEGHTGAEYVLTGPQSLTQREQVAAIGEVLGRPLQMEEISPDEARRELFGGNAPDVVNMLLNAWCAGLGQAAHVTSAVEAITGTPARTFREWVTDHAEGFRGKAGLQ
jgi:uncharacterized protein YbjT (DUF2867 family)